METLKENYRRAAYADYPSQGTMDLKNAFSTTSRLFVKMMFANDDTNKTKGFL